MIKIDSSQITHSCLLLLWFLALYKDKIEHHVFFQGGKALEFEVEEEAAVGTVGGYVSATDNDSGDNALIDYRITGESLLV